MIWYGVIFILGVLGIFAVAAVLVLFHLMFLPWDDF